MKRIRLTSLVFSVLILVIAACSQPEDAQVPGLESQFGTAGYDVATAVSLAPTGLVTIGASFTSDVVDEYPNPPYTITNLQLRQYTQAGNIVRRIGVGKIRCDTEDDCFSARFTGVQTDRLGNVYALTSIGKISGDVPYYSLTLYKYSRTGQQLLWKRTLPPSDYWKAAGHLTLDSNDNVYVAFSESEAFASGLTRLVRYSPRGVKMWQRNSRVGIINDVATAPNGNIYVIGDKGVSRYTSSGGLIWTKAIAGSDLATSGTYFYALDQSGSERLATVSKYGMNGAKLWTTVVAYSDSEIGTVVEAV